MVAQIPADVQASIQSKVESGGYQDAADVMRSALDALDARERRWRLRAALAEGEVGEGVPFNPGLLTELIQDADAADREGLLVNPDVCP